MASDLSKTLKKPQQPDPMPGSRTKSLDDNVSGSSTIVSDKVTVTVRVIFIKIGEIETVKECFSAEAFIQAKWREPALDAVLNDPSQNLNDIKWDTYWNPKLSITNWLSDPKETIWYTVKPNPSSKKEAFIHECRRIKGTFLENLELNEFPFDTQDISLTITSGRSVAEVELAEDTRELSDINIQSFVDEQEWHLYRHIVTSRKTQEMVYQESTNKHPMMSFTCRASRRIGFFIWNIFFVMFLICSMTFTTYGLEYKLIQNRIQLTLVLLLTTVTFKFTVNQSLPKISYLTYLDLYILASMVTICLICIWHGIIGSVLKNSIDAFWIDKWVLVAFVSIYFGGHIALVLFVLLVVLRKRRHDRVKEREYTDKVKRISEMSQAYQLDLEK